jgi:LysM repeat protein
MLRIRHISWAIIGLLLLSGVWGTRTAYADFQDTYVVQSGDTLIDIAVRYGISVGELARANDLSGDAWVYVGQQLVIPGQRGDRRVIPAEPVDRRAFVVDTRVPDPLPQLPLLPQDRPQAVSSYTYARVVQENAPVYGHPGDAAEGVPPQRTLGTGFIWVSIQDRVSYAGEDYYQINAGEYVSVDALSLYAPSTFHGVALAAGPERPFAWILQPVQPLFTPGGEINPDAPLYRRYDLVQIFATEDQGEQVWYLIGPDQWINQIYVGKVAPASRPEGVAPDAFWVEVNLFEQTLAAYEGDQMVYATLISSGLPGWDTPPGLFQVWLKVAVGKMSGGYNRPDYYFLEDVQWTMYFNQDIGLHTAYWHDGFGYKHSHGCVNLPPLDARWLFEWAPEDLWVWVH